MAPQSASVIRDTIMDWLKEPGNLRWITGFSDYIGQKRKKKDAFANLQQYINQRHSTQYSEIEIKNKYDWMMRKYQLACDKSKTEMDIRKVQDICPYYTELNDMFGTKTYSSIDQIQELFAQDTPVTLFEPLFDEQDFLVDLETTESNKRKYDHDHSKPLELPGVELKRLELEAQIRIREKELQVQESLKKEEFRIARMQFVRELVMSGKCKDEIKELMEFIE
ncbi:hypothetical protein HDV06_004666 [Boothiomyces sp. JEL0866]|nr:hypothetical protein HDV06_004666 [Boothiomyces sp. JEL0866]